MGKKRRREGERGGERERVCESECLMTELKTISQCIRFVLTILQFVNDVTYIWTYLVLPSTGYFLQFRSFKSALLENMISSMGCFKNYILQFSHAIVRLSNLEWF